MPPADDVIARLAAGVPRSEGGAPVRVAVDGVDGAGKTTFADALGVALRAAGRPVIRASVDSFHRPRAQRYRRGRNSPSGFWLDSFDYDRLRADLLDPLGPGGSRRYRTAAHDVASDEPIDAAWATAEPAAVLVLDGPATSRDSAATSPAAHRPTGRRWSSTTPSGTVPSSVPENTARTARDHRSCTDFSHRSHGCPGHAGNNSASSTHREGPQP